MGKVDLANYLFNLGRDYQHRIDAHRCKNDCCCDLEGQRLERNASYAARLLGEHALLETTNEEWLWDEAQLTRERFDNPLGWSFQPSAVPGQSLYDDDDDVPF
jgi:hypothetical protein